jgi:hypothetical protein
VPPKQRPRMSEVSLDVDDEVFVESEDAESDPDVCGMTLHFLFVIMY